MASDEQFSLCWNNFHANMSAGFHGLLSRGDLVDVTLAAEGRLLQAHKLVLSVCSPYFQEMFKMNPTHHPIVFLKDVSHSALRDLLQFMYQGEVNVKQEELASFISTAEQLQVKGLTGNQNEESSTPSKPKPTSRPGPRSSQQRQSVMTKLETDLDSKPSSTPVAIKRPNRPSIASNNSSSSQSGPVKRKCVDPLEAGPSGSAKDEFVTIPDEDENNAVAPKMEPEFVNESMWDEDDDGTNNDETNFGEDDSNMEMSGFDGSTGGDGNITGGGEGGAVGDAQGKGGKRKGLWSEENLEAAMLAVGNGQLTKRSAARKYGIPRQTLCDHLKSGSTAKRMGRKCVLSKDEEQELVKSIKEMKKNGTPITCDLIRRQTYLYCERYNIRHNFNNKAGLAGRHWLQLFLERNPGLHNKTMSSSACLVVTREFGEGYASCRKRPVITNSCCKTSRYTKTYIKKSFETRK
ncbi:protein tramtrack, beta isoform isoform X6 [Pararge aegeria]|uniref:protein tramtrack, beta isoform isoform X6 n=1 Tax=Pararge aegeria TaxID=116150 RepID=UPI0019D2EA95|nr:protein tramtrack, beta isoform isoform X6 [Pararge aegeria]